MNQNLAKFLITVFLLTIFCSDSFSQNHEFKWANGMGGLDRDENWAIAIDQSGNTYTTGYFRGTVDFDPGTSVKNITSQGEGDIFIQKFNSKGAMVWTKTIGSNKFEGAEEIEVDKDGNIYITGHFETTVDFDPGPKQFMLRNNGLFDAFLLKLDSKGDFVFAKAFGSTGLDFGRAVQVDRFKNIYVTGTYTGRADMNPDLGKWDYLNSTGKTDVFVVKLNSSGVYQWSKSMGGPATERVNDMKIDRFGNLHIIGHFLDTADFDPGSGTAYLKTDPFIFTTFVVKLNSAGNYVWAGQLGTEVNTFGEGVCVDQTGNVYATGDFGGTADFNPGSVKFSLTSNGYEDAYVVKLNSSGKFQWAKNFGGPLSESSNNLAVAPNGNIAITGACKGRSDMNPGKDSFIVNGQNHLFHAYVSVLSSKGDFVNAFTIGGNTRSHGLDIVLDSKSRVYVAGTHQAGWLEIPIGKTKVKISSAGGSLDGMVAMICQKTYGEISVTQCDSFIPPSGSAVWKQSAIYTDHIKNKAGCDSAIRIHLTILNSSSRVIDTTACDSFKSHGGTSTFTSATIVDTSKNKLGCDSFGIYNVKLNYSSFLVDTISECYEYQSKYSAKKWSKSGIYADTSLNSEGCPLYVTHDLTILEASDSQITIVECDSFVSPSKKYTWKGSGIFHDTIPNAAHCDSIITVNLSIGVNTYDTLSVETCDSMNSPSAKYTWHQTGTYFDTINTWLQCDSFLTINLTVVEFNLDINRHWDTLTNLDTTASFQWIDCAQNGQWIQGETKNYFVPQNSGDYAAILTKNSCTDTTECFKFQLGYVDSGIQSRGIKIYPNPNQGKITIYLLEPGAKSLRVFDFVGKKVYEQSVNDRATLDISHLQNGVYYLDIPGYNRLKFIKN